MRGLSTAAYWWLRSPLSVSSTNYGYVATQGSGNTNATASATTSYGVSFGFYPVLGSTLSIVGAVGSTGGLVDSFASFVLVYCLLQHDRQRQRRQRGDQLSWRVVRLLFQKAWFGTVCNCPVAMRYAANWWTRSPVSSSSANYCNVNNNGNSNTNNSATNSNGVSFGSSRARQSNRWAKSVLKGEKESQTFPQG